jgi:membrane fusion protein
MSEYLFRQEVAQFQDDLRFGEKIFYQPIHLKIFVIALLIAALCFGVFAAMAPLKQTEMIRGHLNPKQGAMKVFSPTTGTVGEVLVAEGDVVVKGQVLAHIMRSTFDSTGHAALDYSLRQIDVQIAQQARHKALIVAQSDLNSQQLCAQIKARQEELEVMHAQLRTVEKRYVLSEKDVQRQVRLLSLGQTASAQHERALDSLYALEEAMQSVQARSKSAAAALLGLEQQLDQEPFARQAQVLEIEKVLAQLYARRNELEVGDAFSLTAPSDGIVSNLLSPLGASVDPRIPFLTLLPSDAQMQALLYVPSRALGELADAQQILLAYDAYPARVFGYFPARIERIAETVLDPREHVFPLDVQEPIFLVRATPDLSFEADNENLSFRSGMQFSAYVVTGQQSLLQRLLSPLQRLRSRM